MPALDPLAAPADLQNQTGQTFDSTRATSALAQASAEVRGYLGWHLYPVLSNDIVTLNGSGEAFLGLPTLHLTDVTLVSEMDSTGTYVDRDATEYEWSEAGYLSRSCGAWTTRLRGVKATITHGYDAIPGEVVNIVCSAAARSMSITPGVDSERAGALQVGFSKVAGAAASGVLLLDSEKLTLSRYRIPQV